MEYLIHLFILICFYTMLAQTLNLSAGNTGLISLAHAGFYGIGAYTTALLSQHFGFSFWLNIPIAMFICGAVALLVSLIALRTVEDYFIICTLGIQVIIFSLMKNWIDVTNGPLGISGIPSIQFFGLTLDSKISFLILSISLTAIIWLLLHNISKSGFGLTLTAISEDEIYSKSIGKNVYLTKTIAFTLSAMFAAIPGTLYAHYISYIDPSTFKIGESIFILSIVIIGGMNSLKGSFFAAAFMILLPELLRFVGMPESIAANMRQIIYGLILIVVMLTGRNGLTELFKTKKTKQTA